MFNNFNLSDEEIIKILEDYEPLIMKKAVINDVVDEDLLQEIKLYTFMVLSKNRKK